MPLTRVDGDAFRKALSTFASGVTVITTSEGKRRWGLTVASFASLSLDPPLVVICLETRVETRSAIERTRRFGVSILAHDQSEISSRFASRVTDRFEGVDVTNGGLGDPLIDGAVTHLECRVYDVFPGGDHTILVGEVVETRVSDREPLLYWGSRYHLLP